MGSDKALLPYQGGRFIEAIHRRMEELFEEVIVATGETGRYDFLPCRRVPDLYSGDGRAGGDPRGVAGRAARRRSSSWRATCRTSTPDLIRHLCSLAEEADVVVPEGDGGLEPLHAVYRKSVLPAVEDALRDGQCRVVSFFDRVRVRRVPLAEVERIDPGLSAFRNINTPEEYYRFRDGGG